MNNNMRYVLGDIQMDNMRFVFGDIHVQMDNNMRHVFGDIKWTTITSICNMSPATYQWTAIAMSPTTYQWTDRQYYGIIMDIDVMNRQQQCEQGYITSHNFSSGVDYSLLWISTAWTICFRKNYQSKT